MCILIEIGQWPIFKKLNEAVYISRTNKRLGNGMYPTILPSVMVNSRADLEC